MNTPSIFSTLQPVKLIIIGLLVGAIWGWFYYMMFGAVQASAGTIHDMRGYAAFFACAAIGMCFACVYLGRWFTGLEGGLHFITCLVALAVAAEILYFTGRLNFNPMPKTEAACLFVTLAAFLITAAFLCRPRDPLFR